MGGVCSGAQPTTTPGAGETVKPAPAAAPAANGTNGAAPKPAETPAAAPAPAATTAGGDAGAEIIEKLKNAKRVNPDNLCAKNFDEAYYNSLTDDLKAAFIKVIKSGAENADSGCGAYAMAPEDYDRFAPFLGKVVSDYHKVPEGTVHVNDWSLEGAEGLPADGKLDLTALGLPELSMRVRVGRNLADFPLPGAMTEDDRRNMENKMCVAFEKLIEQFGGSYNSLTPGHANFIDDAKYNELVKKHFMFKDMADDSYLASAGIASHWPVGRGCYISGDEQFIIWVGEEDHLRIMCMKKGTVLNEIFDRLKSSLDIVESIEGLKFAKSDVFGYITSCPTNLGTGMRASLHIQVPNLTADGSDTKAKAICKPLGLSVRGLGGEHTAIGADGTIDLSPSARFHICEKDIIVALYKGISQLKAAEEAAGAGEAAPAAAEEAAAPAVEEAAAEEAAAPAATGNDDAKIVELIKAAKESNPDNLCAKNFDEEYYNSLSDDLKPAFIKCIKSGAENADSGCGAYAMAPEDYDRFAPFLGKVVADYHKVPEGTVHVNDWSLEGAEGLPEDGKLDLTALGLPELSMRVRVGRNLADFPLPGAMTEDDRRNMENKMCVAFEKLIAEFGGGYNSLTPGHANFIDDAKYDELVKKHFMFKDMADDSYLASAGIASHWPVGRGCYISGDEQFIIWVGEEDHLRIMCMKKGTILNEIFDRLKASLDIVESIEGLKFAKSETFGYITSCPTNLGTGMRASLHIQVPNLTADGSDAKAKEICKPLGLSVRGLGGEHTAIGADGTIDLSPSARFHICEKDIIVALYKGIEQLKAAEDAAAA